MFTEIRNTADSTGFRFFLIIIVLSFVVWGVGDMIRSAARSDLVILKNTDDITIEDFATERYRLLRNLETQGVDITPQLTANIEQASIQNLIKQRLTKYLGQYYQIDFSNEMALQYLRQGGDFDNEALKQHLKRQGISEEEFLEQLKEEMASNILSNNFTTTYQPQIMVSALKNYYAEKNYITLATIDSSKVITKLSVDNDQLQNFYNENKLQFETPELRDFTLATINNEKILKTVEITKDEFTDYKNDVIAHMADGDKLPKDGTLREQLKISKAKQLQLELLNNIEEEIAAGATIKELAGKFSFAMKPLKSISINALAKYTDAFTPSEIFSLAKGDVEYPAMSKKNVSDDTMPVYHILAVDEIIPARIPPLEEIKQKVLTAFNIDANKNRLLAIAYKAKEEISSNAAFAKQMKKNGFTVKQTTVMRDNIADHKEFISPNLQQKILDASRGDIMVNTKDNYIIVTYLNDIQIDKEAAEKLPSEAVTNFLNANNTQEILSFASGENTPEINTPLLQTISSAMELN